LSRRGYEEVLSANDFSNLHGRIIDNHRKLIRRYVIVTPDDEIAEVFASDKLLRAIVAIVEGNLFSIGNAEAPIKAGPGLLLPGRRPGLLRCQIATLLR